MRTLPLLDYHMLLVKVILTAYWSKSVPVSMYRKCIVFSNFIAFLKGRFKEEIRVQGVNDENFIHVS